MWLSGQPSCFASTRVCVQIPKPHKKDRFWKLSHWPASLASSASSRSVRNPVSEIMPSRACVHICLCSPAHMQVHRSTYIHLYIHMYMCMYIHKKSFFLLKIVILVYTDRRDYLVTLYRQLNIHACVHAHTRTHTPIQE